MGGFSYVKTDGGDSGQRIRTYNRPATDAVKCAVGDLCVVNGTATAAGVPQVTICTGTISTIGMTGVVVGFAPAFATEALSSNGLAASTPGDLLVCDDRDALYEVETTTTLAVTDVGLNVSVTATEATANGNVYSSNMVVVTPASTADRPFRIVKLLNGATSGTLGDRVLVRVNSSTSNAAVAGI